MPHQYHPDLKYSSFAVRDSPTPPQKNLPAVQASLNIYCIHLRLIADVTDPFYLKCQGVFVRGDLSHARSHKLLQNLLAPGSGFPAPRKMKDQYKLPGHRGNKTDPMRYSP